MEIEAAVKTKAVRRQSKRYLKPLVVHVLEAWVALTLLLSLYSTPLSLAVDSTVDGYRQFVGVLRKSFPVFLLSNAIIVVIACLSRNNMNNKKKTTATAVSELSDNIYDEYLSRRRVHPSAPTDKLQIAPKPDPERKAEPENNKAVVVRVKEKKTRYRRTKSDVAAAGRPRREAALRRSATENGRGSTVVEDLSNEEFKQTVESYIARTRSLQQKEITAELTETAAVADRSVVVWS